MHTAIDLRVAGADPTQLAELRASGVDHGGNAVEPFIDHEGDWPLRCCLQDSVRGERLAIIAWSPFPWRGPFAEVGPIAVHADACPGPCGHGVPAQFLTRRQIVRPYGHDHRMAYEDIVIVEADGTLPDVLRDVLRDVLARPGIELAIVRNLKAGCFSFTASAS